MVTRHWAKADATKRTSRNLGAASPEQKPVRLASEVVRELLQRRGGTPSCSAREKGEGTQVPSAQTLNGVVKPVAFHEVVAATTVHGQDRRVRGSSHSSLSVSVLRLWLRDSSITASSRLRAVGVTSSLHFFDGFNAVLARRRCKRDNGSFRTVLFSVLSLSTRRTSSLHRALRALAGVLETVKHLAVSPCSSGLGLWSGLTTVYFEEEIEAFVFLFLQRSTNSTGSLKLSLRCTPSYWLDILSYLSTDASLFQIAPDPFGSRGEMAMVAPCCHPFYGTACAVRLI